MKTLIAILFLCAASLLQAQWGTNPNWNRNSNTIVVPQYPQYPNQPSQWIPAGSRPIYYAPNPGWIPQQPRRGYYDIYGNWHPTR